MKGLDDPEVEPGECVHGSWRGEGRGTQGPPSHKESRRSGLALTGGKSSQEKGSLVPAHLKPITPR